MNGEGSSMAPEVVVVGRQFTAPYQVDLTIVRKMMTISGGKFGVTDAQGNIMFKVKGKVMSLRARRVLLDASGNPVVSFQRKIRNSNMKKMNGEGSYMAPEVVVVGRQFTAPYQVDLTIVRKMMTISGGKFGVTDAQGNIMFKVKGKVMSLRARRVLLDADGNPIVSFQKKIMSMHSTWKVYRGDSIDSKDLLFTVRRSSLFQIKTQLDVFLASNTSKDERDFKVKGSWFEKSCTIYAGNSSTVIAQMHRKHSFSSIVLGKDKFAVTVYPYVDYAFIVALVVIMEEINEDGKHNGGGGGGG